MDDKNKVLLGAIIAMNAEKIIGINNDLPWHYSEDLKRFKQMTLGCPIIMGRKTWESIGSKALPKRRNIVISRSVVESVECYHSLQNAIDACSTPLNNDANWPYPMVWIIGGGQIFEQAMPALDLLDITWVPDEVDSRDSSIIRFPPIDESVWQPQARINNDQDPRLIHQRFEKIKV